MSGRVVEELFEDSGSMAMTPGLLTPLPWPDWSARMRSLDVDGARADYVEIGPYRLDVPPSEDRPDAPARMMLTIILAGTSTGEVDGIPLTLSPKEAALIDGRAAMRFEALEPVRAMRIFVDEDHLPQRIQDAPPLPFARLKHTPLVTGCIGFISGLLQVGNPVVEDADELAVSQPLIALQTSLLDEALHQRDAFGADGDPPTGAQTRRTRIEAHVEEHLGDHDLSVTQIATALDVAVRTVHAAFEDRPDTVVAHIRQRRLVRAQAILAARQEPPNLASVADRVGLSRDRLNRIFVAETGLTARQWWEGRRAFPSRGSNGPRG